MYEYMCAVASVVSNSVWPCGLQPARLLCSWDSPGKNTRVGCYALLKGISWPRVQTCVSYVYLHWQAGSLPLVLPGKPISIYKMYILFPMCLDL